MFDDTMSLLMIGLPLVCVLWAISMLTVLKPSKGVPHHPLTPQQVAAAIEVELHPPVEDQGQVSIMRPEERDPGEQPFHPFPR